MITDEQIEKAARAIMESRGRCNVTDWNEAERNPNVAQALNDARAALEAAQPKVKVKPLEWNSSGDAWTPFGTGKTGKDEDPEMAAYPITAFLHGEHLGHFPSTKEAREYVEEEYIKAVRSALVQERGE